MASRVPALVSILLVSLIFVSSVRAEESDTKEFVLTLDHSNFTDIVDKHDFIVVEFYAPWCGHCKQLAPEYEKAAAELSKNDLPIVLAKIDASDESNRGLASKFQIQGFPTIKIFRNGGKSSQEYNGPREADGIVAYLKKQSGPASVEIKSAEDAAQAIDGKSVVIVGVFPKLSGDEYEKFIATAEKMRADYVFAHTTDAKLLPRGDLSVSGPLVRLFKPFDELFVDFKDFNGEALEKFITESSFPLVVTFDNDPINHPYVAKFFENENSKVMLFINFTVESAKSFKSKFQELAEAYKGQGLSFLVGDVEISQGAFEYFGLRESQVPLVIVQNPDNKRFLKSNVDVDQIQPWLNDFQDGKVEVYRKSEAVPLENNEAVKIVVLETFDDMVFNSGKNVFIEFYAPWCGHCKKLAPILEEVAVSFQDDSTVLIAKLDATKNDVPSEKFEVKGFPTMYMKTASGKIIQYSGDRTKEDLISFIQTNKDKAAAEEEDDLPNEETPVKDEL